MPIPLGFKHSPETKEKMRLARLGKPHPMVCHVYNRRNTGNKFSIETRKRMSESKKGDKHPNWKGGLSLDRKIYQEHWKENHREHVSKYNRTSKLRLAYGIDIEEYNNIFDMQDGKCAICNKEQKEFKKLFAVDHNHSNNKVRGLLCSNCNTALGLLKEDINIVNNLIIYLKEK